MQRYMDMKWKRIVSESNVDWTSELAKEMGKDAAGVADTINCIVTWMVDSGNADKMLVAINTAPVGSTSRNILTNMVNSAKQA